MVLNSTRYLMSGTFSLLKNDAPLAKDIDYTEDYNESHCMFDIFYDHSIHTIQIHAGAREFRD